MPKFRTKSAFKKRFRVTRNGKVVHQSLGDAKLHAHKSAKTIRRYDQTVTMEQKAKVDKVKRALGV
jgi:ribosomal protein L35